MKKVLLGTAAILAISFAGAAHAAPAKSGVKLGIGGFFSGQAIYADQDGAAGEPAATTREFDLQQHSEIHFTGETTFDNGLTTGAEIVLRGEPEDEQIQESYIYMSGNWGRFEFGSNYSAAYQMTVAAPGVDPRNFDGPDPDFLVVEPGTNFASEGYVPFYNTGDLLATKATYYTPRFNGFQAGVSYAPDAGRTGDPAGTTSTTGNTNNGGNTFKGPATAGLGGSDGAGDQGDRLELGVNYQGRLAGFGVLAGATYGTATQEAPDLDPLTTNDDQEAGNAGLQLSFQDFTFGGGYYWDNNGFSTRSAALGGGVETGDGETETWYAGVNYGRGPWLVGVSYLNSQIETAVATAGLFTADGVEDELDRWILGGNYEVAPGVKFTGTVQFHEYDRSGATASADNAAGSNDATVVTLGTVVNF